MRPPYLLAAIWLLVLTQTVHLRPLGGRWKRNYSREERRVPEFTKLDACIFLEKYGYLDPEPDHSHSPEEFSEALRDYQKFYGLKKTGELDEKTIEWMKLPRCGVPDKTRPGAGGNTSLNYTYTGYIWTSTSITYRIFTFTRDLSQAQQLKTFARALKFWSDVTPLTFRLITFGSPYIKLRFVTGNHGDGFNFDGPNNVLGHTFPPGPGDLAGEVHFDDDERWTLNAPQGINLERLAAHEFGHALGLGHSSVRIAIMFSGYFYVTVNRLHQDDISGIQSLYGRKTASG